MRRVWGAVGSIVLGAVLIPAIPAHAEEPAVHFVAVGRDTWPSAIDPEAGPFQLQVTNLGSPEATLTSPIGTQSVTEGQIVDLDLSGVPDGNPQLHLNPCPDDPSSCTQYYRTLVVRSAPLLNVWSDDNLLNQNGDDYWESATARVTLDNSIDVTAQWSIKSGTTLIAGPKPFTAEQLNSAKTSGYGAGIPLSAQTIGKRLPAGAYWFEVRTTAVEPDYTKSAVDRVAFHVSTSPALTTLAPNASVFHPRDNYPGVAHGITLSPRLDRRIVRYGASSFTVLNADNESLGTWLIEPADPVIRWDGWHEPPSGGSPALAPAGTYRIQLNVWDGGVPMPGPVSAPFTLSHRYRVPTLSTTGATAAGTRTATLIQRNARVRAEDGSLYYRNIWATYANPLVSTVHRVRVPAHDLGGPTLRIRGRWELPTDIDIKIVTPSGRIVDVDTFGVLTERRVDVTIQRRWIRDDGTLKFRLLWQGYNPGRADRVEVAVWKYVWRG